jgi:hypothetical protein
MSDLSLWPVRSGDAGTIRAGPPPYAAPERLITKPQTAMIGTAAPFVARYARTWPIAGAEYEIGFACTCICTAQWEAGSRPSPSE